MSEKNIKKLKEKKTENKKINSKSADNTLKSKEKSNNSKKSEINQKNNKKNKAGKYVIASISFFFSLLFIGAGLFAFYYYNGGKPKFGENISIAGVDVSNMSVESAGQRISQVLKEGDGQVEVTLSHKEKEWKWQGTDFDGLKDIHKFVESSVNLKRQKDRDARLDTMKRIKAITISEPVPLRLILGDLQDKVDSISREINKEPVNAEVIFKPEKSSRFEIKNDQSGIRVNQKLLTEKIDEAFLKGNKIQVEIPVEEVEAEITAAALKKNTKQRAIYKTFYDIYSIGRAHNIALSLSKMNGKKVMPGEEFSFNENLGITDEANGFKKANIILNGKFVEDYGGGACQASTTLYNALLLADLNVTQVSPHSLHVGYVPASFDAMIATGIADLKFINNTEYPVYIYAKAEKGEARVELYGQPLEEGLKIELKSEIVKKIPGKGDTIIADTKGEYKRYVEYKGEFHRIKTAKDGIESVGKVLKYKNGVKISEKQIRKDKYAPQPGILVEGTGDIPSYYTLPKNM